MDEGQSMLVVLLSLFWGCRTVMFQLFGAYCRRGLDYSAYTLGFSMAGNT